jgi:hypothetical protein
MRQVQINVRLPEPVWRELRDIAELTRSSGRTSVRAVIERFIADGLARRERPS